jgi:hypothetical protein
MRDGSGGPRATLLLAQHPAIAFSALRLTSRKPAVLSKLFA